MKPERLDVDQTVMWRWLAPRALDAGETPSVSFVRAGVEVLATDLTGVHAEITLSGYGTDLSGTEFVASAELEDTDRLSDDDLNHAFIYTQSEGPFPVSIKSIESGQTSVFIDRPLSQEISFPATLQFATYVAEIGSADVTSTVSNNIIWTVTFNPLVVGGIIAGLTTPTEVLRGRIIVDSVFETGLDTQAFTEIFPEFAQKLSSSENTFRRIIESAQRMLLNKLKCAAQAKGVTADRFFGEDFIDAHAYLTAYIVAKHNESERAAGYLEFADDLIDLGIDTGWLDVNGNGEVDTGEDGGGRVMAYIPPLQDMLFPASSYTITPIDPYVCRRRCGLPYRGY